MCPNLTPHLGQLSSRAFDSCLSGVEGHSDLRGYVKFDFFVDLEHAVFGEERARGGLSSLVLYIKLCGQRAASSDDVVKTYVVAVGGLTGNEE